MGTSTARKPPSGRLWRRAKTAAGRYLAAGQETVSAREVLARYVAAVAPAGEEGGGLTPFRLARQAAQELGAFWEEQGGASPAEPPAPSAVLARAHSLAEAWVPEDGSLESAACRSALIRVLCRYLSRSPVAAPPPAAEVVRDFLAQAVAVRLYLDLGETLEAATGECARLEHGWRGLLRAAAGALANPGPPPTGAWRHLAGWLWITRVLEGLKAR
jgi:hypothetical protein